MSQEILKEFLEKTSEKNEFGEGIDLGSIFIDDKLGIRDISRILHEDCTTAIFIKNLGLILADFRGSQIALESANVAMFTDIDGKVTVKLLAFPRPIIFSSLKFSLLIGPDLIMKIDFEDWGSSVIHLKGAEIYFIEKAPS
ncbi:MAG: hypothetical protein PF542_05425 [Nanoarchaeota archaeon]|jgi:hypothetical protein|nr:hypothetical protein [Nanoarchaeota archaeon]